MYGDYLIYNEDDLSNGREVLFTSAMFKFTFKTGRVTYPFMVVLELVEFDGIDAQNKINKVHRFELVDAAGLEKFDFTGTEVLIPAFTPCPARRGAVPPHACDAQAHPARVVRGMG